MYLFPGRSMPRPYDGNGSATCQCDGSYITQFLSEVKQQTLIQTITNTHKPERREWRRLSRGREWGDWWDWNSRWATVREEHRAERRRYPRKTWDRRQHSETRACSAFYHHLPHQTPELRHCVVSSSVSDQDRIRFQRRCSEPDSSMPAAKLMPPGKTLKEHISNGHSLMSKFRSDQSNWWKHSELEEATIDGLDFFKLWLKTFHSIGIDQSRTRQGSRGRRTRDLKK